MSDLGDTYRINDAQQRIATILFMLAGKEMDGLAQGAICKAGKWAGSKVHNDLRNLRHAGLVERLENGNWCLSPKLVQIAMAHEQGMARIEARHSEIRQRYSRQPN